MSLLLENSRFCPSCPANPQVGDLYFDPELNCMRLYVSVKLSLLELMAFAFADEEPPTGEWVMVGGPAKS